MNDDSLLSLNTDQVWVGKSEISWTSSCKFEFSDHLAGAFVWWATQSRSAEHFERKVGDAISYYGLLLHEFTNVQVAEGSISFSDEILDLIAQARENTTFVLYGTFHTYKRHNA